MAITDSYRKHGRCDYVFDMYSEDPSVNDSERRRRADTVPIIYSSVEASTPLPKVMKTFWPSNENKIMLEKAVYSLLMYAHPKEC